MSDELRDGLTFEQWKRLVNRALVQKCGLSGDDLADCNYWDMWSEGETPADAADQVLEENGFPMEDM